MLPPALRFARIVVVLMFDVGSGSDDPLFGKVLHAGIVPHVPEDPGDIRWPGAPVGFHTDEILREVAGLDAAEIAALRREGVVA